MLKKYNYSREFSYTIDTNLDVLGFPLNIHRNLRYFSRLMNIDDLRIYIINEEQKKLLLHTKNQIYPRQLPHWTMFLETEVSTESLEVLGLIITLNSSNDETLLKYANAKQVFNPLQNLDKNLEEFTEWCKKHKNIPIKDDGRLDLSKYNGKEIIKLFKEHEQSEWNTRKEDCFKKLGQEEKEAVERDIKNNKFRINYYFWGVDHSDKTIFFRYDTIKFDDEGSTVLDYTEHLADKFRIKQTDSKGIVFDMDNIDTLSENLKIYICNFLDFINNPDVQIVPIRESQERNLKRARRDKPPIPTYNIIKLKGELKRYIDEARSQRFFEYSHKFIVRGHFRRYWNKDRYRSLYNKFIEGKLEGHYMDKKNDVLMVWVLPYVKGKGIMVDQIYEVKSGNSSHT